jgi:hypothetical protein
MPISTTMMPMVTSSSTSVKARGPTRARGSFVVVVMAIPWVKPRPFRSRRVARRPSRPAPPFVRP